MQFIEKVMTIMSFIIQCSTLGALVITMWKSANKPNKTQDARLDTLERWRESVDMRLQSGNAHFDEIDQGNRVTQEALLALMAHAINGNDTERLKSAKDKLENYLISK